MSKIEDIFNQALEQLAEEGNEEIQETLAAMKEWDDKRVAEEVENFSNSCKMQMSGQNFEHS